MSRHGKLLISLACLTLALAFVVLGIRQPQPSYQGRTLREWLVKYFDDRQQAQPEAWATDRQALQKMGTNAIPQLLEWVQKDRAPWLPMLLMHVPRGLIYRWPGMRIVASDGMLAVFGFELLGSNAVSALPDLTRLANNGSRPYVSFRAVQAISRLGPVAFPVLTNMLADTNNVAHAAVVTQLQLRMVDVVGTNACIPPLLSATTDRDPDVRYVATNALLHLAPETLSTPSR